MHQEVGSVIAKINPLGVIVIGRISRCLVHVQFASNHVGNQLGVVFAQQLGKLSWDNKEIWPR